jgi:predicted AAA+ superfamily ATPase
MEETLVYGMYPDILSTSEIDRKQRYLLELTNSSLYRDILEFQEVKNASSLQKLLRILALRIGSEISYSQIGSLLSMDGRTIERYIDLLEKSYIIFRLPPFFTNKEKELSKMHKIYFYDVGIRNALLGNFQDISVRDDVGKLWENYMIVEQMKHRAYGNIL